MPPGFSHVFWIGGSPCSGKSSIARLLARCHGLAVYHCDEAFVRHQRHSTPQAQPRLHALLTSTCDEIWTRPLPAMLTDEMHLYGEQFGLILDDLRARAPDLIIAEGTALLPQLVHPVLPERRQAIWLVPSEEFQRREYPRRGAWVQEVLQTCRHPQAAFANWMARDVAFARLVAREAEQLTMRVIVVDGRLSIEQNAWTVAQHFGLAPHE